MGKMTDQKYKNYINELLERTMMTNKVKLVLSSEEYVELYSQLAERRMQAFVDAEYIVETSEGGGQPVLVEAENGDTRYSDWAQDEFIDECNIVQNILAEVGIFQEVT